RPLKHPPRPVAPAPPPRRLIAPRRLSLHPVTRTNQRSRRKQPARHLTPDPSYADRSPPHTRPRHTDPPSSPPPATRTRSPASATPSKPRPAAPPPARTFAHSPGTPAPPTCGSRTRTAPARRTDATPALACPAPGRRAR